MDSTRRFVMTVHLLFFAILRDRMKKSEGDFELKEGETVSQLAKRILEPAIGDCRFERSLLYAVNNEYVPRDYQPKPGEEIALIPPVAGG